LRVDGQPGAVAKVGIGDATSVWAEAKPFLTSSAIIAIGGIVGGLGVTILIVGLVWKAIRRAASGIGGASTFAPTLNHAPWLPPQQRWAQPHPSQQPFADPPPMQVRARENAPQ
jgi:hypothetical protein